MHSLFQYNVFVIPVLVGLIAQFTKYIVYSVRNGWSFEYLFTHGHMPSAHTAFAISLLTSVAHYEGMNDGTFAVAVVLAFIIIDDAVRLRVYLGDQGRYLNRLISELHIDEKQFPRLKERIGHKVSEVIAGGIFGFLLTMLFIKIFS
jgi:acid phosphatase family membrane protein YuiD